MSSARDFNQGDQRDQFLFGLKQVIAELHRKGVRNTNGRTRWLPIVEHLQVIDPNDLSLCKPHDR